VPGAGAGVVSGEARTSAAHRKFLTGLDYRVLRSGGFRGGGHEFGLAVAQEVAGVVGVGVVAPLVRAGVLVVPDGDPGDLGCRVVAGGEVAAAQQRAPRS
jgi:hypothetical protein